MGRRHSKIRDRDAPATRAPRRAATVKRLTEGLLADAESRYKAGGTLRVIATDLGISRERLSARLRERGVPRIAAARGEDPGSLTLFPETIEQARHVGGEHGAEGFDYYCTPRAQHPRSASFFDWTSIDKMATFDVFALVPLIGNRPLLMLVGSRAVTSWMSVVAFQKATGPKELHWIDGASHVDLYDKDQYVGPAIDKLTDFFCSSL